jgi:hypothetical protein
LIWQQRDVDFTKGMWRTLLEKIKGRLMDIRLPFSPDVVIACQRIEQSALDLGSLSVKAIFVYSFFAISNHFFIAHFRQ